MNSNSVYKSEFTQGINITMWENNSPKIRNIGKCVYMFIEYVY